MKGRSFFKPLGVAALFLILLGEVSLLHAQSKLDEARIAFSNKEYLQAAELYKQALQEKPKDEKILTETGDVYMTLEFYDTARVMYQRAYDQDSRNGLINRKLGTALSLLGENDEAIEKLRRAYKYEDESLDVQLALADAYLRMGTDSLEKAEIAILQADKKFPNNPRVKVALGDLYFERGVYQLSETYYKQAIDLDPSLIESRIKLGISYREQGKAENDAEFYKKALELFNYVTEVAPKEPTPWRQKGEILYLAGQYEEALNAFEGYMELRPDDPQGDFLFALAASEGQYFTEAIEPALRILGRDDDRSKRFHPEAHLLVSRGYYAKAQVYKEEQPDSARIFYRMAAEAYQQAPDSVLSPNDFIYQGTAWMWQGDTARGVEIWNSMIDRFPDSCDLGFTLTRAMFSYGQYEYALSSLDKLESICGKNFSSSLPMLRGLALLRLDRKEEAIATYNEAIAADSSNVDAYYRLLNTMVSLKQYEEIPGIVDRMALAVTEAGNEEALSWCYYFKGIAYFNADKFQEAITGFTKATELKSDHANAYLYMAVSYHTLKKKEEACVNYRKALQYDPDNTYAKENLKKLGC
ncbi:MAG: tetratricopeptide repeat protein [Ignavibacteriae bacterium]|nr:tetratricopeptide repeat protein [Ignavibacteriota bacterium]MCB9214758.1 tetratricopeptide repeat protein [Ignavibacteria bacterium]